MTSSLAAFPERVPGPAGAAAYRRRDGWYALIDVPPDAPLPHAEFTLEGGAVAVMRGAPSTADPPGAQPVAVYSAGDADAPCVPTGRVLLRFADTEIAADHRRDVEAAGCAIVESLAYAPHAVWIAAANGAVADALRAVDALAAIPGAVAVEPQMLRKRVKR
jgi:hypothetical protein